jgi:hypothetical protein
MLSRLKSKVLHRIRVVIKEELQNYFSYYRAHHRKVLALAIVALLVVTGSFFVGKQIATRGEDIYQVFPKLPTYGGLKAMDPTTFDQSLTSSGYPGGGKFNDSNCVMQSGDWVKKENAKAAVGITMEELTKMKVTIPLGSAFWLDKSSVSCGDSVGIHASLIDRNSHKAEDGLRTFQAVRIGWYGGAGGTEVWRSKPLTIKYQKVSKPKNAYRTVETNWRTTTSFTVGKDWTPGLYLILSRSSSGTIESSAPLIIRSPIGSSNLAIVHSTLTWQAYNNFGGRSLYRGPGDTSEQQSSERSRVVSFDRPLIGSGELLVQRDAIPLVQFAESKGFNVDEFADTDIDEAPLIASNYHGLVFGGHPEYFTQRIFETLIAARNNGINLAFFSGNTAYWRARLSPSAVGPDRHVTVFRYSTEDPVRDNSQVTVRFQDQEVNQPGSLLTGEHTSGIGVVGDLSTVSTPSWLKIPAWTSIKGFGSLSEIESTSPKDISAPSKYGVIFQGKFKFARAADTQSEVTKKNSVAQSIWFKLPSNAVVFNAGINLWACNLELSCPIASVDPQSRANLQLVTEQILNLWQQSDLGAKIN